MIFPLKNAINITKEAKFHAIMHGIFYAFDNPGKIISEYQVGRGKMSDHLLFRFIDDKYFHPIGIELKFAEGESDVRQKEKEAAKQLAIYKTLPAYMRITDKDEIVLYYAVINVCANSPETLISVPDRLIKFNLTH